MKGLWIKVFPDSATPSLGCMGVTTGRGLFCFANATVRRLEEGSRRGGVREKECGGQDGVFKILRGSNSGAAAHCL